MSKKPDTLKEDGPTSKKLKQVTIATPGDSAAPSTQAASSTTKSKKSKKGEEDSDSDASEDEAHGAAADSDDEDSESAAALAKKAKAMSDNAEKSELAAYLSTPSTYISQNPHLQLSNQELQERAEVEELLGQLKANQKGLMDTRQQNQKELEGMRGGLKKIRKETEELMRSQQTNLATMGRKLH